MADGICARERSVRTVGFSTDGHGRARRHRVSGSAGAAGWVRLGRVNSPDEGGPGGRCAGDAVWLVSGLPGGSVRHSRPGAPRTVQLGRCGACRARSRSGVPTGTGRACDAALSKRCRVPAVTVHAESRSCGSWQRNCRFSTDANSFVGGPSLAQISRFCEIRLLRFSCYLFAPFWIDPIADSLTFPGAGCR